MKLKEVRNLGIKYCEENKCKYTYISHNNTDEFYLTESEDRNTVFLVNRNGSLDAYLSTPYASDFHKELKKRRNKRRKSYKKKLADMCNSSCEIEKEE